MSTNASFTVQVFSFIYILVLHKYSQNNPTNFMPRTYLSSKYKYFSNGVVYTTI